MITPDLIKRVEEATGPDRGLDVAIYNALPKAEGGYWGRDSDHAYTASLDAAVALAERLLPGVYSADFAVNGAGEHAHRTPALALILALLNALPHEPKGAG